MIFSLTLKSLGNRKFSAFLVVMSIALSVALLLGVERLRVQSLKGFTRSISGTDLIVGARTGSVNLLLYSVFHVGSVGNSISLQGYKYLLNQDAVQWAVPIALGDNHRGYPLVGTTDEYLEHIQYGRNRNLSLAQGNWFFGNREVVLGAEVADTLGYGLGTPIVIAHGGGDVTFIEHDEHPFVVSGILGRTGTPIDRIIHSALSGIDAIHADFNLQQKSGDTVGHLLEGLEESATDSEHEDEHEGEVHEHHAELEYSGGISAVLLGLKSRPAALFLQREINEYSGEPLTAIMPGIALQELWAVVGYLENGLFIISIFVIVIGLVGMFIALMTTLDQRRREMAVFRAVGARPFHVLAMIVSEAAVLTGLAIMAGVALVYAMLAMAQPLVLEKSGLYLEIGMISGREWMLLGAVAVAGILVSIVPAYRIYRYSLADGITVHF
jgi:putative ABC transport system permease protein